MSKQKTISPEDLVGLSPEEIAKKFQELQEANTNLETNLSSLATENKNLLKENKAVKNEAKAASKAAKPQEHTFEVDETDEDGQETGNVLTYKFVAPKFIVDRTEYSAADVVNSNAKDPMHKKHQEILAHLVEINSGIIELVAEKGGE
jgi:hypothetical protein